MKSLWVILFVVFISCGPSWVPESKTRQVLSSLEKSKFDGKVFVILERDFNLNLDLNYLSGYPITDKDKQVYIGKKGQVIGLYRNKINNHVSFNHYILKLEDGEYLQSSINYFNDNNSWIEGTYFIEHLDSVKNEWIGKEIWLDDKVTNTLEFSDNYSFNRFDKVTITDVVPKYNLIKSEPYYFKVKSDKDEIGYVIKGRGVGDRGKIEYYKFNPTDYIVDEETLNLVKERKVKVGMSKSLVIVSIGMNPSEISTNESSLGIVEWWTFKNPERTIMFTNGKVASISNW
jgi:hypothetical protein